MLPPSRIARKGGGRVLVAHPDEVVVTKPAPCQCCHAAFGDEDHTPDARYDKIELSQVCPMVTRVKRCSGACRDCGAVTLAAVPEWLEPGTPVSLNIMALAVYLRFTRTISYEDLLWLFLELFGLAVSEGALGAVVRPSKPRVDAEVGAIVAPLRPARVIYYDGTVVWIDGKGHWNWVFQKNDVAIHFVCAGRGACVIAEVLDGQRQHFGCPICTARSMGMPRHGGAASHTNWGAANTPSTPGSPHV